MKPFNLQPAKVYAYLQTTFQSVDKCRTLVGPEVDVNRLCHGVEAVTKGQCDAVYYQVCSVMTVTVQRVHSNDA